MSITTLKRIAAAAMVIDYIGAFIPGAPLFLRWIGRLAAPVFLFCMSVGYEKTSDKKKYLLRLYFCGIGMSLINLVLFYLSQIFGFMTTVTSNMFATLFASAFLIEMVEYTRRKRPKRRWKIWASYAGFQLGIAVVWAMLYELIEVPLPFLNLMSAVCGNIFATEGAFLFAIMGVLFYLTRDDRKKLVISYAVLCLIFFLNSATGIWGKLFMFVGKDVLVAMMEIMTGLMLWGASFAPMFDLPHIFFTDYQWMMIVALPLILAYNGRRGDYRKLFYYIFYPVQVYLLWIIGVVILG